MTTDEEPYLLEGNGAFDYKGILIEEWGTYEVTLGMSGSFLVIAEQLAIQENWLFSWSCQGSRWLWSHLKVLAENIPGRVRCHLNIPFHSSKALQWKERVITLFFI